MIVKDPNKKYMHLIRFTYVNGSGGVDIVFTKEEEYKSELAKLELFLGGVRTKDTYVCHQIQDCQGTKYFINLFECTITAGKIDEMNKHYHDFLKYSKKMGEKYAENEKVGI